MQPEKMNVILTGAAGGIGKLLATRLAAAGASLFLADRDETALLALQRELQASAHAGQSIEVCALDLTDMSQVDAWLASVEGGNRAVNVLVNNAGICKFELFDKLSDRDIEQMMTLNSIVPMLLTRRLLPALRRQSAARIVNIGSTFGGIGFPGYSAYCASKYAIRGFSQALSRELSDSAVRVGCIMPRAARTAINSDRVVAMNERLKVAMDPPEKVADAVFSFICSDRAELALGWPEKLLLRLNPLLPALFDSAISKKLPLIKQFAADVAPSHSTPEEVQNV
jgi:short-subunit dehydrogenase